jgi:hypothetical protein
VLTALQRRHDSTSTAQRVEREDVGSLRPARETAEGYLFVEGYPVRAGVMLYRKADGTTVRELIAEDDLFQADSLGTLGRKPVTLEHPADFVSPDNVQDHQVGAVGEVIEREGGYVRISLAIHRKDAIEAVKAGKHQLSPGYTCFVDATPGVHPVYGPYDAVQRDRRYNHVAIVDAARGGPTVRLRADAIEPPSRRADADPTPPRSPMLTLIKLLVAKGLSQAEAERHVDEALADAKTAAAADVKAKADAEWRPKLDAANGQKDALQAKLDAVPKPATPAEMLAYAKQREAILAQGASLKVDGLADVADLAQAKRKVVAAQLGDKLRADATDAYVDAAFDLLRVAPAVSGGGENGADKLRIDGGAASKKTDDRLLPHDAFHRALAAMKKEA